LLVHTAAGVTDGQLYEAAGVAARVFTRFETISFKVTGADGELATAGHGVARIHRQIQNDLLHLAAIDLDPVQGGIEVGDEFNVFANEPPEHFFHVSHNGVEV